jgi:L-asparaginase
MTNKLNKTALNVDLSHPAGVQKLAGYEWKIPSTCLQIEGPFALLHGGLSDQLESQQSVMRSLKRMGFAVQKALQKPALEIALAGARELEADPFFNAGYGARLQRDGVPRLSAALMDGKNQRMAAVSNIVSIRHPSELAGKLLSQNDRSLCGVEATRYAFSAGMVPDHLETEKRYEEWKRKAESFFGTIGCVALDTNRFTAACTSTGGRGFEIPGRVSDSCTPAGNFANAFGAVSCTGVGEEILEASVASALVTRLEDGMSLEEATTKLMSRHSKKQFGFIALDQMGYALVQATRGSLAFALVTSRGVSVGLTQDHWDKITA